MDKLQLRPATENDLEFFFKFQTETQANDMAAFTSRNPKDRDAYINPWRERLKNPEIKLRAILLHTKVVGSVASFMMFGQREATYWLDSSFWGRGIATRALKEFLLEETTRPLFGRVAKHNIGSSRVLEKCGFERFAEEKGFSDYLQRDVEEWVYRLS